MGFFGKYNSDPDDIDDGDLTRVLLDIKGRVQTTQTGLTANYDTIGFETLSVGDAAVALASVPVTAVRAFITVQDDEIRFRADGSAPSSSVGHLLTPDDVLLLESAADLASVKFIRVTADATISVSYQL